jgi:membrane protein implicated in regulation of membrane protease activity
MQIKDPKSARALAGFSAILIVVGFVVLSHSAGFMLMAGAAVCALVAVIAGTRSTQVAGAVLLAVSITFAVVFYPHFKGEQDRIAEHAKKTSTSIPASPAQPK